MAVVAFEMHRQGMVVGPYETPRQLPGMHVVPFEEWAQLP
jgi:hypothetical protein